MNGKNGARRVAAADSILTYPCSFPGRARDPAHYLRERERARERQRERQKKEMQEKHAIIRTDCPRNETEPATEKNTDEKYEFNIW